MNKWIKQWNGGSGRNHDQINWYLLFLMIKWDNLEGVTIQILAHSKSSKNVYLPIYSLFLNQWFFFPTYEIIVIKKI